MNDIFSADAFNVVSLTAAINKVPFIPGRVGKLGLFREAGVTTTTVVIEETNGTLKLVANTSRGAPPTQNVADKRKARSLVVPHLPMEDRIQADEVQGVRAFGSASDLQSVQGVVNDRLARMAGSLDATIEHLRIGAIKGVILDADGSTTLFDLFSEFGVSQYAEVDFDLDNGTPTAGALRKNCNAVIRNISDALGAAPVNVGGIHPTGYHAFCSSAFWDDLISHPEVTEAYKRMQDGQWLRQGMAYGAFEYGGIVWEEYRGSVNGVDYIAANKCHIFPVGVPDLFVQSNAPANFIETVNTIGLPRYAKVAVDEKFQRWVDVHTQSNPLPICTRPKVLIKGKRT